MTDQATIDRRHPSIERNDMTERGRFEAWAESIYLDVGVHEEGNERFVDWNTQTAWAAWQAATPPPTPDTVNVPREPTEAMWSGLARDLIMAWEMFGPKVDGTRKHLGYCGYKDLPDWLEKELGDKVHLAKGDRAVLIYKAMLAAQEKK